MKPIIAIDCETGGLDETKHALLSVGLVELDESLNPVRLKEIFIMPTLAVQEEAAKINGYATEEWDKNSALGLIQAFDSILRWLPEEFTFIAHNSQFDKKFFEYNFYLTQNPFDKNENDEDQEWICTKKLYQSIAGDPCNLSTAAVKVGHWPHDYSRHVHGALIDALACAAVYKWCKGMQPQIDTMKKNQDIDYSDSKNNVDLPKIKPSFPLIDQLQENFYRILDNLK